jgi:hypothetical protein
MLQFVKPHFLGGGLIVPPVEPGWGGAIVREIAQIIADNEVQAEALYEAIAEKAPHLGHSEWEEIMLMVMRTHKL